MLYCPPWLGLKSKRRGLLSMNLVETVSFRNWGCLSKIKIKSQTILFYSIVLYTIPAGPSDISAILDDENNIFNFTFIIITYEINK